MEALQHPYTSIGYIRESKKTLLLQFIDWCKNQEENRVLWLAIIIASHGCIVTPFTVLAVVFTENSMLLWAFTIGAMAMALVSNLAALPTKFTIPIFLLSLIIDLVVIINCIAAVIAL